MVKVNLWNRKYFSLQFLNASPCWGAEDTFPLVVFLELCISLIWSFYITVTVWSKYRRLKCFCSGWGCFEHTHRQTVTPCREPVYLLNRDLTWEIEKIWFFCVYTDGAVNLFLYTKSWSISFGDLRNSHWAKLCLLMFVSCCHFVKVNLAFPGCKQHILYKFSMIYY